MDQWPSHLSALEFSPDGATLAVAVREVRRNRAAHEKVGLHLIPLTAADDPGMKQAEMQGVHGLAFSPDGKWLAWSTANAIRLMNRNSGEVESLLGLDNTTHYSALAFSPDGRTFAAGSIDRGAIFLWNFLNRECVAVVDGHSRTVSSARFAPDGRTLLSGAKDGTLRLWRAMASSLRILPEDSGNFRDLRFRADGRLVAVSPSGIQTIDPKSGATETRVSVDLPNIATLSRFNHDASIYYPRFIRRSGEIDAIETATGKVLGTLARDPGGDRFTLVTPHPANQAFVVRAGEVQLWDATFQERRARFETPESWRWGLEVNCDGSLLASWNRESRQIHFLDGATLEKSATVKLEDQGQVMFTAMEFHPFEPNLLAAVGNDGSAVVVDAGIASVVHRFSPLTPDGVNPTRFSRLRWTPDGKHLLLRDARNGVRMLEVATGRVVKLFNAQSTLRLDDFAGRRSYQTQLSFVFDVSPDGRFVAVNSFEEGISIWRTEEDDRVDPRRLAEVMDYFTFANPDRRKAAAMGTREARTGRTAEATDRPETLQIRRASNILRTDARRLEAVSGNSRLGILQRGNITREEQGRALFNVCLDARNWNSAAVILRQLPAESSAAERARFVTTLADAIKTLLAESPRGGNTGVARRWLAIADEFAEETPELLIDLRDRVGP